MFAYCDQQDNDIWFASRRAIADYVLQSSND
jgi:hypothetical protein